MRLALVALVAAVAVASASASTLAARVQNAAVRNGFSGEVAVARHGHIAFAHGYGLSDRTRGTRVTLDTAFNLASMGRCSRASPRRNSCRRGSCASATGSGGICRGFRRRCVASPSPSCATNTSSLPPVGTSVGGCYSSARDLLAFASALEDGRLVRREPTKVITTPKVRAPGGGYGFGFGIRNGRAGDPPTIWHNGGAPGAAGELDINPKLGVVAVTLGNVGPPQVFPVVDTVLDALGVP